MVKKTRFSKHFLCTDVLPNLPKMLYGDESICLFDFKQQLPGPVHVSQGSVSNTSNKI